VSCTATSASSENDDNKGCGDAPRQSESASSATAAPVARSLPGVGLISILQATSLAIAQCATCSSVGNDSPANSGECQLPASSFESSAQPSASARPRPDVVRSSVWS